MSNRKHTHPGTNIPLDRKNNEQNARHFDGLAEHNRRNEYERTKSEQGLQPAAPQPAKAAQERDELGNMLTHVQRSDYEAIAAELERVKAERDELLAACKACKNLVKHGPMTNKRWMDDLRAAIAKAERGAKQ